MRCLCVEYLGAGRALFECPAGHRFEAYVFTAKQRRLMVRVAETSARQMAHWWRQGVIMDCPHCKPVRRPRPRPKKS